MRNSLPAGTASIGRTRLVQPIFGLHRLAEDQQTNRRMGPNGHRVTRDMSWIDAASGIRNAYSHQKQDAKEYEVHEVLTGSERLKPLLDLCLLSE